MDFDSALALAQSKGLCREKSGGGYRRARRLPQDLHFGGSIAFGKHVYPEQVKTEGITDITLDDVEYADSFGCTIKLIGQVPEGSETAKSLPLSAPRLSAATAFFRTSTACLTPL